MIARALDALRAPDPRYTLGLLRLVLVGYLLFGRTLFVGRVLRARAELPEAVFTDNLGLRLSPLPWPMSEGEITALVVGLALSGLLAFVGLFTRPSLGVFALLHFHAGAADSAYGFFNHVPSIFCAVLILLVLLPGTESLGLDARRRHGDWLGPPAPEWGTSVLLLFLCTVYVGAGIAKTRNGGLDWWSGEILDYYLHADLRHPRGQDFAVDEAGRIVHYLYNSVPTPVGVVMREVPGFALVISALTVIVELAFPFALWRRARRLTLAATIAMHIGIAATISIGFYSTIALLLALMGLPARLVRRLRGPDAPPAAGGASDPIAP